LTRTYSYIRARELEGTYPGPPDVGAWLISTMRVVKGWGAPPEAAWPYRSDEWPRVEPPFIDAMAKPYRNFAYYRPRTLDDCRAVLSQGQPIGAAVAIDASWNNADGRIEDPGQHEIEAIHSIGLIDFDDERGVFKFANGWGPGWGDGGCGYLPYAYWGERLREAWCPWRNRPPLPPDVPRSGRVIRTAGFEPFPGRRIFVAEAVELGSDEVLGWAIASEYPPALEIEELFVRPASRGAGVGSELGAALEARARELALSLRGWIPHSDWPLADSAAALLGKLGLGCAESAEPWASGLAS
jgi:GNAT superfamily N-acetyltransferase